MKRRAGKTIGAVSQEFLVMTIQDEQQRELEIVTQWQGKNVGRIILVEMISE